MLDNKKIMLPNRRHSSTF